MVRLQPNPDSPKLDPIIQQTMYVLVAPDGSIQPTTLSPDEATCLGSLQLMHSAALGLSTEKLKAKGFYITPVKVTVVPAEAIASSHAPAWIEGTIDPPELGKRYPIRFSDGQYSTAIFNGHGHWEEYLRGTLNANEFEWLNDAPRARETRGIDMEGIAWAERPAGPTLYKYGAISSCFSLEADNRLTAYATMIVHCGESAHLLVIYSPEDSKKDRWTTFANGGDFLARLDEIFGGPAYFEKYVQENKPAIMECYKTIKRLI